MDSNGFQEWIPMDFNGFLMDSNGFFDSNGLQWIPTMDSIEFQWTPMDSNNVFQQWIPMD